MTTDTTTQPGRSTDAAQPSAARSTVTSRRSVTTVTRLLTLLCALAATFLVLTVPADAATVADVDVTATAVYESCPETVTILPMTNEEVGGPYTVWARASVWETGRGWVVTDWTKVDGHTSMMFYDVGHEPYAWAYMTYASYTSDGWRYSTEYTQITDALDNGFCPVS